MEHSPMLGRPGECGVAVHLEMNQLGSCRIFHSPLVAKHGT